MAVSLVKREKVNLKKTELTRKLPEITPVHLIDEEETIVKRSSTIAHSDVSSRKADISKLESLHSLPEHFSIHCSRKRIVIGIICAAVVIFIISIILLNLSDNFFQELSKGIRGISSILDEVFAYISSNSLLSGVLAISFIAIWIQLLRKVFYN